MVTNGFDQIGKTLISGSHGKLPLSNKNVYARIISTPTHSAKSWLIADKDGLVSASTITPGETRHLTGTNNDIKDRMDELVGLLTGLGLDYHDFKNLNTTSNLLYVNAAGELDVSSTSLEYATGMQLQMDDLNKSLPDEFLEKASVGNLYGVEVKANESTTIDVSSRRLGGQQPEHDTYRGQINIDSDAISFNIIGACTALCTRIVYMDGSTTIHMYLTVRGFCDFDILIAKSAGGGGVVYLI